MVTGLKIITNKRPMRFALLILSLAAIFFTNCKKAELHPIISGSTITLPAQQNKIIYLDLLVGANTYTMWVANYDGSGAAQINVSLPAGVSLSGNSAPKWSSNDKKIYFNAAANSLFNIYSCNFDGSGVQLVVAGDSGMPAIIEGTYYTNQQSKILYAKKINYASQIWTANADGTSGQQINLSLPGNEWVSALFPAFQFVLSPDNKTVFFTLSTTNGSYYIYSCDISGGSLNPVMINPSGYQYSIGGSYNIAQQGKIVYVDFKGSGLIMTANLDGTGAQPVDIKLPEDVYMDNFPPKVLPDGNRLFFNTLSADGSDYGIYSCNIDGSDLQLIVIPASQLDFFTIGQAF
jgi:Tol biopolymer transport system component